MSTFPTQAARDLKVMVSMHFQTARSSFPVSGAVTSKLKLKAARVQFFGPGSNKTDRGSLVTALILIGHRVEIFEGGNPVT